MRGHLRGCWSGPVAPRGPKILPGSGGIGRWGWESGVFPCEHSRRGAVLVPCPPGSRADPGIPAPLPQFPGVPSLPLTSLAPKIHKSCGRSIPGARPRHSRSLPGAIPGPGAGCGSGTARGRSCLNPWNQGWEGPCSQGFSLERSVLSDPTDGRGGIPPGILVQDPPGLQWDTLGCCRISHGCCGVPRDALECPWDAEGCPGVLLDTSGCLRRIPWDAAELLPPSLGGRCRGGSSPPAPQPPPARRPRLGGIALEFCGKPGGARWLQHLRPHPSLIRHGFPGSAAQPGFGISCYF